MSGLTTPHAGSRLLAALGYERPSQGIVTLMSHSNRHRMAPHPNNRPRSRFGAIGLIIGALLLGACARAAVDPALVGVWELPVPGGTWRLAIDGNGHYQFTVDGGNAAAPHGGAFSARDGEWTMHATNIALDDHGHYEIGAGGSITLTGNRGVLSWRHGAAPLGAAAGVSTTSAAEASTPAVTPIAASATAPKPVAAPPSSQAAAAKPLPSVAAPRSSGAALPDTIDPCLLVTAAEAAQLLGTTVEPQRTTPQPHMQNDCRYHPKGSDRSVAITTYNGGGLDVAGYLANHARDSTPLEGVGDAAYFHYQAPTKLAAVNWVIGSASFEILVAGVPRERAEPVLRGSHRPRPSARSARARFRCPGSSASWARGCRTSAARTTRTW